MKIYHAHILKTQKCHNVNSLQIALYIQYTILQIPVGFWVEVNNLTVKSMQERKRLRKARAIYENLIDQTNDPDILGPLLWLRQREVVHYNRFKELSDEYKSKGYM